MTATAQHLAAAPGVALLGQHEVQIRGFQHRVDPSMLSVTPSAFERPITLIALDDIADFVDYQQKGLSEWRDIALVATNTNRAAKQKLQEIQNAAAHASPSELQALLGDAISALTLPTL